MNGFSSFGQPEMKIVELSGDADNLRVNITARKDGIMQLILSMMGIAGTAAIHGDAEGCVVERSSFAGQSRTYVAWSQVSTTSHNVTKATAYLGTALPLFVFGLSALLGGKSSSVPKEVGFVFLGLAAVMVVLFFIKRSVVVGLLTTGGSFESIKLKGSAAQMAELKEVMKVMELLNRAASDSDTGHGLHSRSAAPSLASPIAGAAADTTVVTCPSCQGRMKVPGGRAGQAMRCPKCSQTFTL